MVRLPGGGGPPTGTDFVNLVDDQIGVPYVFGADSPSTGFDCSGLVKWAADKLGLTNFPRTSEEQWGAVQRVSVNQLQAGDLIFLNFPGEVSPGHVVIYAGGDSIVQAPSTGQLVQRDTVSKISDLGGTIVGYGRIPGLDYSGEKTGWGGKGPPSSAGGQPGQLGGFFDTILKSLNFSFWSQGVPSVSASTSDIAQAIGSAVLPLAGFAEALDWFMHPSHWIRLFAGVGGALLVGMGIWQMSHV